MASIGLMASTRWMRAHAVAAHPGGLSGVSRRIGGTLHNRYARGDDKKKENALAKQDSQRMSGVAQKEGALRTGLRVKAGGGVRVRGHVLESCQNNISPISGIPGKRKLSDHLTNQPSDQFFGESSIEILSGLKSCPRVRLQRRPKWYTDPRHFSAHHRH